jgi:uncharacterized protein YecT (DUF1311 family)
MRHLTSIIILAFTFSCFSQTQNEMHVKSSDLYKKADDEINLIYQKILTEYQADSNFIDRLKKTQKIWIEFRNAELEMKYPAEDKKDEYGSSYNVCALNYLTYLTKRRTEHLKIWLAGINEEETCAGSVKIN